MDDEEVSETLVKLVRSLRNSCCAVYALDFIFSDFFWSLASPVPGKYLPSTKTELFIFPPALPKLQAIPTILHLYPGIFMRLQTMMIISG